MSFLGIFVLIEFIISAKALLKAVHGTSMVSAVHFSRILGRPLEHHQSQAALGGLHMWASTQHQPTTGDLEILPC